VRTADPSAYGRRSAAIGGDIVSPRACLNRVCRFYFKLQRERMVTGMGMGLQTASEMGMKFEMHGSWNRNNLMGMGVLTTFPLSSNS